MKIVIVTSCSFPASEGLGTHVKSIAENYANNNHDVEVYIRRSGKGAVEKVQHCGVTYVLIPSSSIPVISSFVFKHKCETILNDQEHVIDVIHYHSPLVLPLNIKHEAKVITTVHSTMIEDTKHIEIINVKSVLYKLMGRFVSPFFENSLFKASSNVIAVSAGVKDELYSLYKLPTNKVKTIANGIDLGTFRPLCSVGDKTKTIVYIGRVGFRKGIPELVEAIRLLKNDLLGYRFLIIGSGDLDSYLEGKINEYALSDIIDWKKHVSQESLPQLLSSSRFLIMPSSYETGPRVVLESISCLTPTIATQVGLVPQIDDSAYIKIDQSSADKVRDAIQFAINLSPEAYDVYVEACRLERNNFNRDISCQELLKTYEN
ncbi:hypothetical protein BIT28_19035 [Photobacterium proteolyticum]|uniref:Glycosyltransferase n=1 Tax=Photobacterium proteolyticum TaxID=1903952 RepID=A0A1Q9GN72_9GAMM|nr:glycosyltransferase family 4 protein [Photobacterium proteolyticum]OLQ76110.1 hypothetical protein BIT28_19035 [Photobacterium proteolyticum]